MSQSSGLPVYRHQRTGIWQLRRTIPTHLRRFHIQPNGKSRSELSPVSLGTRDEKQARLRAALPWAEHLSSLNSLDRGRANVGEAKKYFRSLFEQEDVQPDLEASKERERMIRELEDRIETLKLWVDVHGATDDAKSRLEKTRLKAALGQLLKLKETRTHEIARARAAKADMSSPEIVDPVLDHYVDRLVMHHPQPVDNSPLGRMVRSELREIVREEALAALIRSDPNATISLGSSQQTIDKATNATDLTPPLTVLDRGLIRWRCDPRTFQTHLSPT